MHQCISCINITPPPHTHTFYEHHGDHDPFGYRHSKCLLVFIITKKFITGSNMRERVNDDRTFIFG